MNLSLRVVLLIFSALVSMGQGSDLQIYFDLIDQKR